MSSEAYLVAEIVNILDKNIDHIVVARMGETVEMKLTKAVKDMLPELTQIFKSHLGNNEDLEQALAQIEKWKTWGVGQEKNLILALEANTKMKAELDAALKNQQPKEITITHKVDKETLDALVAAAYYVAVPKGINRSLHYKHLAKKYNLKEN